MEINPVNNLTNLLDFYGIKLRFNDKSSTLGYFETNENNIIYVKNNLDSYQVTHIVSVLIARYFAYDISLEDTIIVYNSSYLKDKKTKELYEELIELINNENFKKLSFELK